MQPLHQLLSGLIDYAGLFPPAGLDMPMMVNNYVDYLSCPNEWMLGRVVVPLAKLDSFRAEWPDSVTKRSRISLLTPPLDSRDFDAAVSAIDEFNNSQANHKIDAVEARVADPTAITNALKLNEHVRCFIEVPPDHRDAIITAIADLNQPDRVFAKIRTGGVKPEMIPSADYVASFIIACGDAGVGLKFTAGLHHPFRADYPLTYEPGCDVGRMHGFLNVFLGSCFANTHGLDQTELTEFIDQAQPDDLTVTTNAIAWREHQLTAKDVAATRERFAISFGSCSFTEPIEDLTNLSLLPETPHAPD